MVFSGPAAVSHESKQSEQKVIAYPNIGNSSPGACHETMRRDHMTNRCYIPCEDWDWQTKSEKGLDSASAYITLFIYAVCLIVTSITWIKLKHL
jgi:hypothetical protein